MDIDRFVILLREAISCMNWHYEVKKTDVIAVENIDIYETTREVRTLRGPMVVPSIGVADFDEDGDEISRDVFSSSSAALQRVLRILSDSEIHRAMDHLANLEI